MKLTFDELNLLVKTLSEKQNELETKKILCKSKNKKNVKMIGVFILVRN